MKNSKLSVQNPQTDCSLAINELSECLRDYVTNNGEKIDEKYRNISGIGMKIENIRFVYSGGQSGLAGISKLEKEIVCLYKENKNSYNELLNEAKIIYSYA